MHSLRVWMVVPKIACCLATASAAMAPRLSLEGLIDRSTVIIEGHVTRSWIAWDSGHRYIWTHYEIGVEDNIRGSGSTITISEPGGSLDGVNEGFSGSVGYASGEHVMLFLFRTPIGYWRTTGGAQGKLTISADGRIHGAPGNTEPGLRDVSAFKSLIRSMARSRAANEVR